MSLPEGGGGAFALPSPTHVHQMDVSSAVRSLRRSISRSPSRFLSRTNSRNSDSSTPASPQSPCRRFRLTPQRQHDHYPQSAYAHAQSAPPSQGANASQNQAFTPLRPSVRLSLRSAKSAKTLSPSRQLSRIRASPKSPLRRALNASSDQVTATAAAAQHLQALPATLSQPLAELESNKPQTSPRPTQQCPADKPSRHSFHLDVSGSSENALWKSFDPDSDPATLSGGLKRNDAMMNLDQPYQGSPVPKRRSMYGASGLDQQAGERGIFGTNVTPAASFKIHEDSGNDRAMAPADAPGSQAAPPTPAPSFPKRSSSLRKSTAVPRTSDKGSWGKRTGQRQLAQLAQLDQERISTTAKPRAPVAFNQFEPPNSGNLFGSATSTNPFHFEPKSTQSHHPLAQTQTLSASSSADSFTEETSAYAPAPPAASRFGAHPFSRSLPVGAERPTAGPGGTPNQGRLLYQGAFGSTGLISKVNRNPEHFDKKLVPPDTPCKPWKRQTDRFNTYPTSGTPGSAMKSRGNNRNSFAGISSLTFQPPSAPSDGLSSSIFGPKQADPDYLVGEDFEGDGSLLANGAEERGGTIPPTPTKNGITPSLSNLSELSEHCSDESFDSPSANRKSFGPKGDAPLSAVRPSPLRQPNFGSADSLAERRSSPRTPRDLSLPETTSQLSISRPGAAGSFGDRGGLPPATPTTERDFRSSTGVFSTPVHHDTSLFGTDSNAEPSLQRRFDEVTKLGDGEFSIVYRVKEGARRYGSPAVDNSLLGRDQAQTPAEGGGVYVVKKSKQPYLGPKDRERKLREARILGALKDAEHVVQYIGDWETNDYLYIQTEYCENGSLKDFYAREGFYGRLDDFCIFKILLDLSLGLKEIHDAGFMHLDMKPANVFVTFEGALKIGDFGLARSQMEAGHLDMEGDREYMAPEMLHGRFGPSSDIFSLGMIIFEAIANVEIPGNGEDWHKLRSGDFSGVPSLAWTASCETNPHRSGLYSDDLEADRTHDARDLFGSHKRSELLEPPSFMEDALHPESLRSMVSWMMSNSSLDRPTADQLLCQGSLQWIANRRQAPATIFEGRWGPVESEAPTVVDVDTEMTGV